ncbi:hypothetical protein LEMLEM_LOCUS10143 [Lemmus lemmus]
MENDTSNTGTHTGEPSRPGAPRLVASNLLLNPENVQADYRRCKVK